MNEENYITVKCIEIKQPIGVFYVAAIDWKDISQIARADIRRIEKGEGGKVESYLGIQRRLSDNRVKEIANYVKNVDATFPTAILLHISSSALVENNGINREVRNVIFNRENSELQIRNAFDVAHILDGQHRIEGLRVGFSSAHSNSQKFQLNVSIFVDLDMDNQSMVFATVNKAQTKVNKSLVYDLFAYANSRSPQRTAHNIVRLLDEKEGSPFQNMVKILGTADDKAKETITQATLVESIIRYISKDPMADRDKLKRKEDLKKVSDEEVRKLIFRNLFIEGRDADIAKIIWNYFSAIKSKWPSNWENTLLSKSTGVIAFMRFLRPAYLSIAKDIGEVVKKEDFDKVFEKVDIKGEDFTKEHYLPGTTGQSKLYQQLIEFSQL